MLQTNVYLKWPSLLLRLKNMHRENITNLLNRRNFLNQSKQGLTNQANIEKSTSFIEVTSTDQLKKTTTENSVTTS